MENSDRMADRLWTWISRHRDFWIIIMEGLPSVIPKSIVEVLNRLKNDEDNLFSWKLTRSQDKFSVTRRFSAIVFYLPLHKF